MKVLAAGDHFVRNSLIAEALRRALADTSLELTELTLPWPLEPFGPVAEVAEASDSEDALIKALDGVEVCVTQMAPFTERVLEASPALRMIAVCRGGPVNVNAEAARARGVRVCFAPGRNAASTAEFTIGLMLSALRRIPEAHHSLALEGDWDGSYYTYEHSGLELEDTPVGLVGYGAVGSRVARVLTAFGAEVEVYDPYVRGDVLGMRAGSLDALLTRSRVLTLHARLTPETRGLIGARELELLPHGAVLVNAARGGLLDTEALCDALDSGRLAAAALDTYAEEPLPEGSRLLSTPNLVLTPHIAGASRAVARKAAQIAAAEVARYARSEPLAHTLN
ncbi:2-hydroxyacid dehydrogenase [Streptomyces jumonjinensis]|uniref:Hydroxyacid dehydrogenase n=1 Tax=Streptomyces jumonjinensis TaxID=1945 RepID=A0A646KII8_STRJU|nr:2-hydroxyacid dehydrogenase [Streptomyces jumonjinensis]MQT01881.1 hydroxyacid dehydrogenase [Streptomyces jumonjinensis]